VVDRVDGGRMIGGSSIVGVRRRVGRRNWNASAAVAEFIDCVYVASPWRRVALATCRRSCLASFSGVAVKHVSSNHHNLHEWGKDGNVISEQHGDFRRRRRLVRTSSEVCQPSQPSQRMHMLNSKVSDPSRFFAFSHSGKEWCFF